MEVSYDTRLGKVTLTVTVAVKPEEEPAVMEYLNKVAEMMKRESERLIEERLAYPLRGGL